jgi:predicted dehydrogenase
LFVLGVDPINVSARGAAYVQPGIHDVAYLTVNFPNQVMAGVQVSWLDPCKIRRITIVGSKKMVVYDDVEPDEKIKIYDKGVDTPPYSDTLEQFRLSYRYGEVTSPRVPTDEPLHVECAHFIECIREGKTPRSSGEVGLKIVRILEKAQASLLNGGQREILL